MTSSHLSEPELTALTKTAQQVRVKTIKILTEAGSGHPGGSLGMADIFTALYFKLLNHSPDNPEWKDRDYLLLSNGHICPVLYATLAQAGYFPQKKLQTLRKINSDLQGHPKLQPRLGIEISSGPLGQGLSQACGLALAFKKDNKPNHIFCLLSDGEQQEGQTWEAYMLASKYQLNNITAIIDRNHIQIGGDTEQVMPLENLKNKIEAFGWSVLEINGHDFSEIVMAVNKAKDDKLPFAIIANTVLGKGVSFMENNAQWHGKAPNKEQANQAIKELLQ